MNERDKLVLYGAGHRCKWICEMLRDLNWDALTLVDSDSNKWGEIIAGYRIEPPEVINELWNVVFCITVADQSAAQNIREQLWTDFPCRLKSELDCYALLSLAFHKHPAIQELTAFENSGRHRKRVLFDCIYDGLGLGGVESWTIDICTALLKDGAVNTHIVVPKGNYEVPQSLKGHMIYIDAKPRSPLTAGFVVSALGVIKENLPCKVVTRSVNAFMLAARLVKECCPDQIEIISVIHGSSEAVFTGHLAFKDCIDTFVSVSMDIRKELIARGIEEERLLRMQMPFFCKKDLDRCYTVESALPIKIGYAGRLSIVDKRVDILLKLAEILQAEKVNFKLEIAGAGEYEAKIQSFLAENRMNGQICLIGQLSREEISSFWERQDICVSVSDSEGRSISIIEAMGSGAVPVVTATSGVREDIEDGVNGYIVPLRDYGAMADRIAYLSAHRDLLPQMGVLAHEGIYPKSLMEPHLNFWRELLLR